MPPMYRTKDGYTVEVVRVAELERYFPLGELEADALARRRAQREVDQYELEVAQRLRPDSTASRSIAVSSASVKSL
jgi:hypothetical protein